MLPMKFIIWVFQSMHTAIAQAPAHMDTDDKDMLRGLGKVIREHRDPDCDDPVIHMMVVEPSGYCLLRAMTADQAGKVRGRKVAEGARTQVFEFNDDDDVIVPRTSEEGEEANDPVVMEMIGGENGPTPEAIIQLLKRLAGG